MNLRGIATTVGIGIALCSGCSLFVGLDGLSGGADAGASTSDAALDQSSVTNDAAADASGDASLSYSDAVLADHPLAYFHFDETSGSTAFDSSGNQHDAQYANGFSLGAGGAFSGAGTSVHLLGSAFVAIDDTVDDAGTPFDFVDHQPFSLEAWVNLDVQPVMDSTEFTFFSKEKSLGGTSGGYNGIDFFSEPNLKLQREDDPNDETEARSTSGLAEVGHWYYLVGVFDGTTLAIFVDGTQIASADSSSTSIPITGVPFIFGAEDTAGDNGLLGLLDEAAIYDKALTHAQMAAHLHAAGR